MLGTDFALEGRFAVPMARIKPKGERKKDKANSIFLRLNFFLD